MSYLYCELCYDVVECSKIRRCKQYNINICEECCDTKYSCICEDFMLMNKALNEMMENSKSDYACIKHKLKRFKKEFKLNTNCYTYIVPPTVPFN